MSRIISVILLGMLCFQADAQCLVAEYNFSGNTDDTSGHDNHGILYGATLTTDRFGNEDAAYYFDGEDDFIDTETSFDFEERTVSVWFSVEDTESEHQVIDQDALSLEYGAYDVSVRLGGIYANAGGDGSNMLVENVVVDQWYHVVVVRGTDFIKYYVDGELVLTSAPTPSGSINNQNEETVIGTYRAENGQFFRGKIDDIKIYDCVLEIDEIESLYTNVVELDELKDISFSFYPNPMSDQSRLEFEKIDGEDYNLFIYDNKGGIVHQYFGFNENYVLLNRNMFRESGLYTFVLIDDLGSRATGKFIVE